MKHISQTHKLYELHEIVLEVNHFWITFSLRFLEAMSIYYYI